MLVDGVVALGHDDPMWKTERHAAPLILRFPPESELCPPKPQGALAEWNRRKRLDIVSPEVPKYVLIEFGAGSHLECGAVFAAQVGIAFSS